MPGNVVVRMLPPVRPEEAEGRDEMAKVVRVHMLQSILKDPGKWCETDLAISTRLLSLLGASTMFVANVATFWFLFEYHKISFQNVLAFIFALTAVVYFLKVKFTHLFPRKPIPTQKDKQE